MNAEPAIHLSPSAVREIKKLGKAVQKKVIDTIEGLRACPRPPSVEKISGHPDFLRVYVGRNHRLIYHIRSPRLIVVLVVRDRKDAYRGLDTLDQKLSVAIEQIASLPGGTRLLAG